MSDGEGAAKKAKIDDDKTDDLGTVVSYLAMPYTVEEEAWLRNRDAIQCSPNHDDKKPNITKRIQLNVRYVGASVT